MEMAAEASRTKEIAALLVVSKFEEAAEILAGSLGNRFNDVLEKKFERPKDLPKPLPKSAVHMIARLAQGIVLTTNFDRTLEEAFAIKPSTKLTRTQQPTWN
jgi:5,10-methenyltetrahydromethanopterin hydrogenase